MKTKIQYDDLLVRISNILFLFTGIDISFSMIDKYLQGLDYKLELQTLVLDNLWPKYNYATGDSILQAAETIAKSQIDNGLEELED